MSQDLLGQLLFLQVEPYNRMSTQGKAKVDNFWCVTAPKICRAPLICSFAAEDKPFAIKCFFRKNLQLEFCLRPKRACSYGACEGRL